MASLADLFNPSFFIILGIVALLIALMVVYFESKMREQNHKIASMLSLVSTLAEDMNGVKMGLNHLAITSLNGGNPSQNVPFPPQNLGSQMAQQTQLNLIEVSDDESEEDATEEIIDVSELEELEDEDEDDNETTSESNEDDDITDEDENIENIKVIKLNISENIEDDENSFDRANNLDFEPDDDLAVLDDMDEIPEISECYAEELLSLKYDEEKEKPLVEDNIQLEETVVQSASDFKTISINLGDESHSEHIEYKKLQLPKLRSIAVEKGLTTNSEAQKLKKPELLKLLGAE
jgi:hypothetical protein